MKIKTKKKKIAMLVPDELMQKLRRKVTECAKTHEFAAMDSDSLHELAYFVYSGCLEELHSSVDVPPPTIEQNALFVSLEMLGLAVVYDMMRHFGLAQGDQGDQGDREAAPDREDFAWRSRPWFWPCCHNTTDNKKSPQ